MARTILLDTGVIVALTNRKDPDHARCVGVWKDLRAQLVTVEGVLVEASHLLSRVRGGARHGIELTLAARTQIHGMSESSITRVLDLMDRYQNVPMDFVDGCLVVLAETLSVREILTLDRRGFETYRISGRQRFVIVPD